MKKLRATLIKFIMKMVNSSGEALKQGKRYIADIAVIRETPKAILVKLAVTGEQYHNPVVTWVPKSQIAYWKHFDAYFVSEWLIKKFEFPRSSQIGVAPPPSNDGNGAPLRGFRTGKRPVHWKELTK